MRLVLFGDRHDGPDLLLHVIPILAQYLTDIHHHINLLRASSQACSVS